MTSSDSISIISIPQQIENIRKLHHQRYIDKKGNVPIPIEDDESIINIKSNFYGINEGGKCCGLRNKSYDKIYVNRNLFNPFDLPFTNENKIYSTGVNSICSQNQDIVKNIVINNPPFSSQKPPKSPNYIKKTPWKRNTCLVVGDSILNGIQEDKMSSNQMIKV